MVKTATAIRFESEEREWIQSYADFRGKTFSDVVREAILERIEDETDVQAFNEAMARDDGEYLTMDELLSEYGMRR
jgi:predicted DNA-binding protein